MGQPAQDEEERDKEGGGSLGQPALGEAPLREVEPPPLGLYKEEESLPLIHPIGFCLSPSLPHMWVLIFGGAYGV